VRKKIKREDAKMAKKFFLVILIALVSISFCTGVSFAQDKKVTIWKMQSAYALHTASALGAVYWANQIEKVTNGRLKVEQHAPGSLCTTTSIIDMIEQGVVDCAMSYGGYYTGVIPECNLSTGLPMVHQTMDECIDAWLNRGYLEIIREAFSKRGIYYCFYPVDNWYNYTLIKPIKTLDDLKGLKIRALGVYGRLTQLLGASAVSIPGPETYMALKLKTVDGALYSAAAMVDTKVDEVTKYTIYPTAAQITADFYISQKSLDKLPADVRHIVISASDDIFIRGGALVQIRDQDAQRQLVKKGVKRIYLSDADVKKSTKIAEQIWDEIATKNERCKKGVAILKQQLKDLGRLE
jgi:TRAP-type C4-dicarboxylate transport system substrate-binding protein